MGLSISQPTMMDFKMFRKKTVPVFFIASFLFSSLALASDASKIKAVEAAVKKRYPDTPIIEINTTPVKGIYEIVMDRSTVAYTEESGRYFFFGKLIDVVSEVVLTDKTIKKHQKFDTSSLPFSIKRVIGNGEGHLWVFTDPQCPFCRKMEDEIDKLKNATVFYIPLAYQGAKSEEQVGTILCSKEKLKLLKDALKGKNIPNQKCNTKDYENIQEFAFRKGISATPTIVNSKGEMHSGFIESNDIAKFIEN